MTMHRRHFLLGATAASILWGASPTGAQRLEWRGQALGAEARIVLVGERDMAEATLGDVVGEIRRLEAIFSLADPDSQLCRLNRDGRLDAPAADLRDLLGRALALKRHTAGRFDPAVQPLWIHVAKGASSPLPLERIRGASVAIAPNRITLSPGAGLTLNGIAQGTIADRVADLLARRGFRTPVIDAGEVVLPGEAYRTVDIPAARLRTRLAGVALATSTPAAMKLPKGRHHLLDPATGESPMRWRSLTVVAPNAELADALSTGFAVSSREHVGDLVPDGVTVIATHVDDRVEVFGRQLALRSR